jgi:hypothetical protein
MLVFIAIFFHFLGQVIWQEAADPEPLKLMQVDFKLVLR